MWSTGPGRHLTVLPSTVEGHEMPTEQGWMTTAEAAEALGIAQSTIKSTIHRGKLKVVRVSRLNFITPEALEEYRRAHAGRQGWDKRREPGYEPDPARKARRAQLRARQQQSQETTAPAGDAPAREE